MEIQEFVKKIAEQYFDTPAELFKPETEFRQFEEWSSMTGLCILTMIKDEFGFFLDPATFKTLTTIQDVYNACVNH